MKLSHPMKRAMSSSFGKFCDHCSLEDETIEYFYLRNNIEFTEGELEFCSTNCIINWLNENFEYESNT